MQSGYERHLEYIAFVGRKRSLVPQLIRLAIQRYKRDKKRKDIYFDQIAAETAIGNIENFVHARGQWQDNNIVLQPWQCFIVANLFGWKWSHNNLRRFRYAYIQCPRKQGKSLLSIGIALNMFALDNEKGAEVYFGATTEAQARDLLFYPAQYIVEHSPDFIDATGVEVRAGSLVIPSNFSKLKSVIRKPDDGYSPHCVVVDEYHLHEDDSQYSTFDTGMGSRQQPLLMVVTTAGHLLSGPCKEERDLCIRVLEQRDEADTKFALIYEPDEHDKWDDPKTLAKVNPNLNVSISEQYLLDQLKQARVSALKQNAYRTKHLNQWVGARTVWMNHLFWQRQKRQMEMSEFRDVGCHVAIDLASKKDLTAMAILFKTNEQYYCFSRFYAPEKAAEENDYYKKYSTSGHLTLTPGSMTDYRFVMEDIYRVCSNYHVKSIAFDNHQAAMMITLLQEKGLNVIDYAQTVHNMSDPMKEVDAAVADGKLWHDGNPVLTWNMGNCVAYENAKQHVYPRRENDNDPTCKIDGVVALIMAMGRWLQDTEPKSYLESSGVEHL